MRPWPNRSTPLFAKDVYKRQDGGRPFMDKLQRGAAGAKAIVAWGTCASWGCVQAARPNPTQATPIHKVIHDKPIIKGPGCPAIPDVMSNIVAYILTYDQIPKLDSQGRPEVFYGKRVHDQCVRRAHFDAGQFVESWDDAAASLGYCLYKMGCKGPTTYNACPVTRWNNGVSYPIQSGHGCIGCAEQNFWDHGSFYSRITNLPQFGTNTTAETVGVAAVAGIGAGVVTHAAISTACLLYTSCTQINWPPSFSRFLWNKYRVWEKQWSESSKVLPSALQAMSPVIPKCFGSAVLEKPA